jgi:hypothetical protein
MDSPTSPGDILSRRLRRLERYNRIHRAVLTVLIGAVVVGFLVGSTGNRHETLSARRIRLDDESGKTRVMLKADDKEPGVGLFDENGQLIALFAVLKDEGALRFYDADGTVRCGLGQDRRRVRLSFFDSEGEGCAEMGVYPSGPGVRLGKDDSWNSVWAAIADGRFVLTFRDAEDSALYSVPPDIEPWQW